MKKEEFIRMVAEGRSKIFHTLREQISELYPDRSAAFITGVTLQVYCQQVTKGSWEYMRRGPGYDTIGTGEAYDNYGYLKRAFRVVDKTSTDTIRLFTIKKNFKMFKDISRSIKRVKQS